MRVSHVGLCAALIAMLVAGGCAQAPAPSPERALDRPAPGAFETSYDRAKWRWMRNPDGRMLLAHSELQKCFVDPRPDEDYNDPGFSVRRERKAFGDASYDVLNVYQKREFWIAVYRRAGAPQPFLGVYSDGPCRAEAERIVQAYESGRK